ncbi:hypothetical protein GCM10017774_78530 [Lentzea cavernae]|uniref:Uncharacterized protein n=1 Tax=Lentzea cavernae TaxID=2020703 RepID=A0ABQ3MQK3_9PSEU|nr:hypothetical protein GCM10017774_78530 [Lentzea cavernae]
MQAHVRNGGALVDLIPVRDRATALHVERVVLKNYLAIAPVSLTRDLLPQGGTTECWSAHVGYPDLRQIATQ